MSCGSFTRDSASHDTAPCRTAPHDGSAEIPREQFPRTTLVDFGERQDTRTYITPQQTPGYQSDNIVES